MIFVSLGSQKFQFNRLLKKLDELCLENKITEPIFAQTGHSDYQPQSFSFTPFLDRDSFLEKLKEADLVITHGGTGVIVNAIKLGKKVIALPRLAQYGEHVDDHQTQLIEQFSEANLILTGKIEALESLIETCQTHSFASFQSNTAQILDSIERFINS